MRKRNSNIELLRIIAMLLIVMEHFTDQAGLQSWNSSINDWVLCFLSSGSRVSVNIFLIIGIWFMVDRDFEAKRIIRLYSQLLFTSVLLTTIAVLLGADVGVKDVLRGYMPFFGRTSWFVSAYITLYFFTPFLNKFFEIDRKRQTVFVVISFISVCFVASISSEQNGYVVDSLYFLFMYIWIGYVKKYCMRKLRNIAVPGVCVGAFLYVVLVTAYYLGNVKQGGIWDMVLRFSDKYLIDIKTLPNIAIAFFVFLFIVSRKERHLKIINMIASTSLEVYLFHTVSAFIPVLWFSVFHADKFVGHHTWIFVAAVAMATYAMASVVDLVRIQIEGLWMKSGIVLHCERILENVYGKRISYRAIGTNQNS